MLRRGEPTENNVLEGLSQRIKILEDAVSRRALPPGYKFSVNGSNQLVIERLSDSATVVIL